MRDFSPNLAREQVPSGAKRRENVALSRCVRLIGTTTQTRMEIATAY
jgi:hypothetical protein